MSNAANKDRLPKKPEGWFSRRHQTDDANIAARERYQSEHGKTARKRKAKQRLSEVAR